MKAQVIECDRCGDTTRADSREAVSFTQVSVLKSGVCKEYDLCPNDADAFKAWLASEATVVPDAPVISPPEFPLAGDVQV